MLAGKIALYLNFTRPDISHVVHNLSQFIGNPCALHWEGALHILKHLKGNLDHGLFYSVHSSSNLVTYSDADWAKCKDSRKSISGYCVFLRTNLISWKSKKQVTVSHSFAEAEYQSVATTVCEILWLSYVLQDLQLPPPHPIPLWCDNQTAIYIATNPLFHERTKHIEIDCHHVRHHYKLGFIAPDSAPHMCNWLISSPSLWDYLLSPLFSPS